MLGLLLSIIFLFIQLIVGGNKRGAIATIIPELQPLQQTLLSIDDKLTKINKGLDNAKKETSEDARKELQNIGVSWSGKNFLDAIKAGDERIVELFLRAGMRPETAESDGRSLAIMLSLNEFNPEEMLSILLKYGLNINQSYKQFSSIGNMRTTLLGRAIEEGNIKLVKALLKNKSDTDHPIHTYGKIGITINTYPLASAIYWRQLEIVLLILDAKPDISVGDYAAYRQAYQMKEDFFWKSHSSEMNSILLKTAPPPDFSERINIELRLQEIDKKLNDVALKSLNSYSNPSRQRLYDQQYNELQKEKRILIENMKDHK